MIYEAVYGMEHWGAMLLIVGMTVTLSLAGLFLTTLVVPLHLREANHDGIGGMGATVGVIYAVLLAFIAVAVWEGFEKADNAASLEASLAGDVFRDAPLLPPGQREAVASALRSYVDHVIDEEWPIMAAGDTLNRRGWEILEAIPQALVSEAPSAVQAIAIQEVFHQLNKLYDARRDRIALSTSGLQPVTWAVVLAGSIVSLFFCWLLAFPTPALHVLCTTLVSVVLGLIIFLIISYDYPFRGKVQIGPDAFLIVQENMRALERR